MTLLIYIIPRLLFCELSTTLASFPAGLRNLRGWETKDTVCACARFYTSKPCYFRAIPCFYYVTNTVQLLWRFNSGWGSILHWMSLLHLKYCLWLTLLLKQSKYLRRMLQICNFSLPTGYVRLKSLPLAVLQPLTREQADGPPWYSCRFGKF